MANKKKVVLSEENQKLLESICSREGTEDEARKDPNFMLEMLLEEIDRQKRDVSACLLPILRQTISQSHVAYVRRHAGKKAA